MSDDVKKTSWTKRVGLALLCCLLLLFVILIFLRIFITTAPGSRFIEKQINMRSFGPIEAVTITGLSGDPLKAISIDEITIKDKEGDWVQLENFDMTWKPLAFLKGHVWIQGLTIETTSVLRKPVLNRSANAGASNGSLPKITLENYTLGSVSLNEAFIGQSLSLTSSGQFISDSNGAASAVIKAARLDVAAESLNLNFTRTEQGGMTGLFDIEGAAGGPIASLLKSPTNVSGTGKVGGDYTEGNATAKLSFGNDEILTANSNWTASQLTAKANINLYNWPAFDIGSLQLGPTLETTFKLDRDKTQAFLATLNAPGLSLDASGNLPEDGFLPAAVDVNVIADKLSSLIMLPENYDLGRTSVNGRVNIEAPYEFDALIHVEDLKTPHGSAAKLIGPLRASQTLEGIFDFKTDFIATEVITTATLPVNLDSQTQLKSSGQFDTTESRLVLQNFDLTSGVNQLTGQGTLTTDGLNLDISVKGTAAIKAAGSIPEGALNADIAVQKTSTSGLAITADGVFRPNTAAADPIGGLIGEQIIFNANINPTDDGITISEASIIGENVRAALTGTFNEQLDLSGEAILSAPVNFKSVMIDDGAEASFIVTGSRMDPIFRLDAKFGSITAQHYVLNDARLRTEIKDILSSPKGPVQIDAETAHGALSASTQFTLEPSIFAANDIDLAWGRLTAKGDVKIPSGSIAIGEINLNLPERDGQYARAALTLSDAAGEQGVEFTADAKRISFSGFEFDVVSANAAGTLSSLAGVLKANGQRGDSLISPSFELDAPFTLTKGTGGDANDSFKATILPQVKYGAITVTSNAPTTATFSSGNISLSAPLLISGGTANLEYKRSVMEERLKLEAKLLPVRLIPMPGSLADTRGQISAEIDLYTQLGLPLQGGGVVNLTDWRGFDVDKGDGITGNIRTTIINGKQADITLIANALSGFKVDGNLRVPLSASQTLTGTRLDMAAPLKGQLSTSGSAASIFGLLTPSDAELGGSLLADITIAGTANKPRIEGQAQGDGLQFEMPELGTRLRNGRIKAQFTNESLSVSDLYVADADDGTLSGSGDFKLGDLGRLIGELNITANNFRALDRQDVDAKVKGKLKLVSAPKDATLSGNITLSNVEVKEFVQGTVSVIEIDVDEINRPDQKDVITFDKPETPINLDISLRAPRKIFVRSRGLDVEMAVEAEIQGTVSEPLFYGEAKVVRGGYKLGGKTLEFETGIITFEGDLPSAQVDFTAVTQTQNLEGTLKIGGTVKKPEIELSSSPERPQDEILSALLFDRSATEISALEAAQLAGALAQFSGTGSGFDLLGGVRNAFGINQLSVNVNAEGDAQLVGGRYLAKNVYLEVFSGADTDQTGAIIDWEIRKNIALRSRVQADNDQSVSLKWKRDF